MMILPPPSEASRFLLGMKTVTFPGRYESLPEVSKFVTHAARQAGLDPKAIYAVELAVDEACSNIIDHAYAGEDIGDMECTVSSSSEGLTVILRDYGQPFDPMHVPEPKTDVPLERLRPRGVGLFLMRKMMDRVYYESTPDQGNVLTMFKRRQG